MINWRDYSNLRIFKSIRLKKTAVIATENADGTETDLNVGELVRIVDVSSRIVTTTATALSLTVTAHSERIVLVNTNSTVANTVTLPLATGTGAKFTVINNITQTQGSVVVAANGTTNVISGVAFAVDSTGADTATAFYTTATSDRVTFNITTTGGLGGDTVEAYDVAANTWLVRVFFRGSGTLATPFSAT